MDAINTRNSDDPAKIRIVNPSKAVEGATTTLITTLITTLREFFGSKPGKILLAVTTCVIVMIILISDQGNAPLEKSRQSIMSDPDFSTQDNTGLPDFDGTNGAGDLAKKPSSAPAAVRLKGPKLMRRVVSVDIPGGSVVEAVLITGAKSGPVKAKLTADLKTQFGETVLPEGTTLIGDAQSSHERLAIKFSKALTPDGGLLKVTAEAMDHGDRTPGLRGEFATRQALLLSGGIALNALSGIADGLQTNEAIGIGIAKKPTLRNAMLNGASRASMDQAKELTTSFKDSAKSITVASGTKILIFFGDGDSHD